MGSGFGGGQQESQKEAEGQEDCHDVGNEVLDEEGLAVHRNNSLWWRGLEAPVVDADRTDASHFGQVWVVPVMRLPIIDFMT